MCELGEWEATTTQSGNLRRRVGGFPNRVKVFSPEERDLVPELAKTTDVVYHLWQCEC